MEINSNKKLAIALAISLLVNSFLIGIFVSHSPLMRGDRPMHPQERMMKVANKTLPDEYRDQIEEIIEAHDEFDMEHRDTMRDIFDELNEILTADKFNENNFNSLIDKIDNNDKSKKRHMTKLTLSIAKALPDNHRIKFFKKLFKHKRFSPPPPRHR